MTTFGEQITRQINDDLATERQIISLLSIIGLKARFDGDILHITGNKLTPPVLIQLQKRWEVHLNDQFYFRKLR